MKSRLVEIAQYINRRTPYLGWLKRMLGLDQIAINLLTQPLADDEIQHLKESVDHRALDRQVEEWIRHGGVLDEVCVVFPGKLGDLIACEPIVRYFRGRFEGSKINWLVDVRYRSVLENNADIDKLIEVNGFLEAMKVAEQRKREGAFCINCLINGCRDDGSGIVYHNLANPQINYFNYYYLGSLLAVYCAIIGIPELDETPKFVIDDKRKHPLSSAGGRYAVIHPCSDEESRNWNNRGWRIVTEWLVSQGLKVVEIGGNHPMVAGKCGILDFTGRRDLQDLALLINDATVFIGVESSFAHLANAMGTRSVVLMGKFRGFEHRMVHSGRFARSSDFRIVQAPAGKSAKSVRIDDVIAAVKQLI